MKRFVYLLGALVVFDIALFTVNKFNEWRGTKPAATSVAKSAVLAPVRAEQKTIQVNGRVAVSVE